MPDSVTSSSKLGTVDPVGAEGGDDAGSAARIAGAAGSRRSGTIKARIGFIFCISNHINLADR
jgi:hypothetical protein